MDSRSAGLRVAGTLFALFALAHLWRLVRGIEVVIGRHHIPMFVSIIGAVIAAGLSFWMWKLSARDG